MPEGDPLSKYNLILAQLGLVPAMATSEQSVSDFIDKVQNGLNQLKTLEGTVDQAYGDFLSSEKASVSVRSSLRAYAGTQTTEGWLKSTWTSCA